MRILQIAASGYDVFGLGEDGKVYLWNRTTLQWVLYQQK